MKRVGWNPRFGFELEASKRISPDLINYVEIDGTYKNFSLLHFKRFSLKKVYFHMFKQSYLAQIYEERLGR